MAKRLSIALILIIIAIITHADNHLQVLLTTKAATFSSTQDVIVTAVFTNTGDQPIRIHTPAVPKQSLPDQLFTVTVDGAAVKYIGPAYKRVAPSAAPTVIVKPGESINGSMSLSSAYDLGKSGKYEVRYDVEGSRVIFGSAGKSKGSDAVVQVQSNALVLAVAGRANVEPTKIGQTEGKGATGRNQYTSCSRTQQARLVSARSVALGYAQNAYNYLAVTTSRSLKRYPTWFGTYTQSRWNKVKSNYLKIKNALNTVTIRFDCTCTDSDIFAYVYVDSPYVIYLCGIFWDVSLNGTDSKGGTLIHEMSHFTVVAQTDDYVYGQTSSRALAISSPGKAIQNADNHEYFAENTPFQS